MLSVEELFELEDNIREELDIHLTAALASLNRSGRLEEFLQLLGMEHLLEKETGYEVYKTGKIVVIGQSDVKAEVLLSIAKKLGLDKSRFELHLDYDDAKNFNSCRQTWFQWLEDLQDRFQSQVGGNDGNEKNCLIVRFIGHDL